MPKPKNPLTESQMKEHLRALNISQDITSQFSFPIYKVTESGQPDLVGTGFVIDFDGLCYFVTAAHVMDLHETDRPLFYFIDQKNRQYIEGRFATSSTDVAERNADRVDVIVVRLPPGRGRPDPVIGKAVIQPHRITQDTSKLGDCRFVVSGYPLTKFKPDPIGRNLNSACYTWVGKSIPDKEYSRLKFSKSQSVLVQFARKHILRSDGLDGAMFPVPIGLSGSPVWHSVGYRNDERILVIEGFCLAAVLIEHISEGKCFLATSIDIVMAMIFDLQREAISG